MSTCLKLEITLYARPIKSLRLWFIGGGGGGGGGGSTAVTCTASYSCANDSQIWVFDFKEAKCGARRAKSSPEHSARNYSWAT